MSHPLLIRKGKVSDRGIEPRTIREKKKKIAEKAAREALEQLAKQEAGHYRAIEIAQIADMPWRMIACALRRLARRGEIIEQLIEYRSEWRYKEITRAYKLPCSGNKPLWLVNFL